MTTRVELRQICEEIKIPYEDRDLEDIKKDIRAWVDKRIGKKKRRSADNMSVTLRKFLTLEYDYAITNKEGDLLDHNLEKIKK
jgi:hypothetical protein